MKNQRDKLRLPATDPMPGPGDFPVGSIESRAAARRQRQHSLKSRLRQTIIMIGMNRLPMTKARIDPWFENKDGSLTRNVFAPSELSEEDSLAIFGTRKNPFQGKKGLFVIHH